MNDTNVKIPLTIGVTGHLNPREADLELLRKSVKEELLQIRARCPHSPVIMLNALACGADLLCAEVAEELGIPLRAVLPMEQAEYEKDFPPEDLERMRRQVKRAESVFTAPAAEAEPPEENRDFRYRQAGIYMAEHSHILLALWDGKEGTEIGTGGVVRAALDGAWQPRRGMACRRAENIAVRHIYTPREGDGAEYKKAAIPPENTAVMEEILAKTEEFNRLAEEAQAGRGMLLPEDIREAELVKLDTMYSVADGLSIRFARVYRRTLAVLAVLCTLVTLTFLLYDEAELIYMMLACGIALLAAILITGAAKRSAGHRRYIEYRMLAEALRVQLYLRCAGSRTEVQRIMTWTQQQEMPWILCAMCAVNAVRPPEQTRDIREIWVENQRKYHEKAAERTRRQSGRNNRLLRAAGICAVLLYFGGLVFELLCGGLIFAPSVPVKDAGLWRMIMKILLGTVSAGTLFLASYYGKMSLERKQTDHGKMKALFTTAGRQMERLGQTEELLETLAREELTENGNWCSYQQDNAPELNI